jgi:hypothetical protein
VALVTVPATVFLMHEVKGLTAPASGNANFITADEHQALQYLARLPQRGGVLTRFYLGAAVPAETGRRTYVGDCLWSEPGCGARASSAQGLFDGRLAGPQAEAFVAGSRARFVLGDCSSTADLSRELAPILGSVTHFGCATVYEVDPSRAAG